MGDEAPNCCGHCFPGLHLRLTPEAGKRLENRRAGSPGPCWSSPETTCPGMPCPGKHTLPLGLQFTGYEVHAVSRVSDRARGILTYQTTLLVDFLAKCINICFFSIKVQIFNKAVRVRRTASSHLFLSCLVQAARFSVYCKTHFKNLFQTKKVIYLSHCKCNKDSVHPLHSGITTEVL